MIRTRGLAISMIVAVVLVGLLAYWDELRESEDALDDFGAAQAQLADTAAMTVRSVLQSRQDRSPGVASLLRDLEHLTTPGSSTVFVLAPDARDLQAADGHRASASPLVEALRAGATVLRLAPSEAAALGLRHRTAMAGLARVDAGLQGKWGLVVVRTAERQRDRDRHGEMRLVLSTLLAAGLVTVFGGMALRKQRAELQLSHDLAVATVAREKDAQLEKLSRAATMAAIASGVAHEISTPLAVIVGRAEQLLARANTSGDERAVRNAKTIIEQSEDINRIVRGLLGIASGAPLKLETVNPEAVVDEALALVRHRYETAGVQLQTAGAGPLPAIRCEPLLLKHALVNLLLNACDASRPGSAVILDARADAVRVCFVVLDEGEGITAANAQRATEPFFTTKPPGRGTGLGLAIANEIAKTHRGSLSIAPRSPRGTRASIQIPLEGSLHGHT